MVSGSGDCTVKVWETMTGKCTWTLIGHSEEVVSRGHLNISHQNVEELTLSKQTICKFWYLQDICRRIVFI